MYRSLTYGYIEKVSTNNLTKTYLLLFIFLDGCCGRYQIIKEGLTFQMNKK